MKLYNQLSRKIEEFRPLNGNEVRMYSCGPTVYDHAHIGNLSAYVFADMLRRSLELQGYKVIHAMNYTDVDDKTIRRSRERFADDTPKEALKKLTDTYIQIFHEDMEKLGNSLGNVTLLRATDNIEPMQQLITTLYNKGFAYIADDGIYFSIEAYKKSGKTYGQLLELTTSNTSEARIQNDEYDKDSVHDFVLWKSQKADEPAWEFHIDGKEMAGRPGWHIECSAMSHAALGQPFDIHTGGIDLMFPHHENEIAQSTAAEENPLMARFFTHNDHLLVDGKKMSKSLHNFHTLEDITKQGYDPLAFRVALLQGHYRGQGNFTQESLEGAQNRLRKWQALADLHLQPKPIAMADIPKAFTEQVIFDQPQLFITQQLGNDLNTGMAITWLDRLSDDIQFLPESQNHLARFRNLMEFMDKAFGLDLSKREDITDAQKALISERQAAREAKDFAKADQLRDELEAQQLTVRDTVHGSIWSRL